MKQVLFFFFFFLWFWVSYHMSRLGGATSLWQVFPLFPNVKVERRILHEENSYGNWQNVSKIISTEIKNFHKIHKARLLFEWQRVDTRYGRPDVSGGEIINHWAGIERWAVVQYFVVASNLNWTTFSFVTLSECALVGNHWHIPPEQPVYCSYRSSLDMLHMKWQQQ